MANILDMSEGGATLDTAPSILPMDSKRKKWEAMWDAARIGFKDTIRGVQQIAGVNEEALAEHIMPSKFIFNSDWLIMFRACANMQISSIFFFIL